MPSNLFNIIIEDNDITPLTYTNSKNINIRDYAFENCSILKDVTFQKCDTIGTYAFYNCSNLIQASFPSVKILYDGAFNKCINITDIFIPNCNYIDSRAFSECLKLKNLYINNYSGVCNLFGSNTFFSTPFVLNSAYEPGYIYVHPDWVESYKNNKYWSYFSSYISGLPYTQ